MLNIRRPALRRPQGQDAGAEALRPRRRPENHEKIVLARSDSNAAIRLPRLCLPMEYIAQDHESLIDSLQNEEITTPRSVR
jgi:hypothetical protein